MKRIGLSKRAVRVAILSSAVWWTAGCVIQCPDGSSIYDGADANAVRERFGEPDIVAWESSGGREYSVPGGTGRLRCGNEPGSEWYYYLNRGVAFQLNRTRVIAVHPIQATERQSLQERENELRSEDPAVMVGAISLDEFKTWAEEPRETRYCGPYAGMRESTLGDVLGAPDAVRVETFGLWCCTSDFAPAGDFPRNAWSPDVVRTVYYADLNQAIVFQRGYVASVARLSDDALMQYAVRRRVNPTYRDPLFDGLWARD